MKKSILAVIIIIAAAGIAFGVYKLLIETDIQDEHSKGEIYTCPMHPQIEQDHPGVCPICNMDLVLKENTGDTDEADTSMSIDKEIGDVVLSPTQQVLASIQTEKVMIKEYSKDMTFNGYVKVDQKNSRHISTTVGGKITKMFVNFEGQVVNKGDPVFELYSPEVLATEKEYLLALENYEKVKDSNYEIVVKQAENLLNSTKTRLRLWDVTPEQIEELETTGEARQFITVYSKYSGIVTKKLVHEGHWAVPGEDIYDIEDLSTVWVIANVPESDAGKIKLNQSALISSVSYPDEFFNAKVNFINRVMNSETRTLEIRLDVTNRNYKLKPDMYVTISLKNFEYAWNIVVPRNAVLRTGKMDMIYVKKDKNVFSPRRVTVGGSVDGNYLITSGLKEGEEIVTSAGFLLDSESQIRFGSGSSSHDHTGGKKDSESESEPVFDKEHDAMKDIK